MDKDEVSLMERVVDEVSDWGANIIVQLVNQLSIGGRPFGMDERTPEEQLIEYLPLRYDPNKAFMYMVGKYEELMQRLSSSGASPVAVAAIHPSDLIVSMALDWSSRMEALIDSGKYNIERLGPPPPTEPIQFQPPINPQPSTPAGYKSVSPTIHSPVSLM